MINSDLPTTSLLTGLQEKFNAIMGNKWVSDERRWKDMIKQGRIQENGRGIGEETEGY